MPQCVEQPCFDIAEENQGKYEMEEVDTEALRNSSLVFGAMLTLEAYMPILIWYMGRNDTITSVKSSNGWYYRTWQFMTVAHAFVFGLPALLWPFTYLGSQTVNDMYILMSYFLVILAGLGVASLTTLLYALAYLLHEDNTEIG